MYLIKLVIIFVVFSSVEPFIPYSLADIGFFQAPAEATTTLASTTGPATTEATTILASTTRPATTEDTTTLASTTRPASTMSSEATYTPPTKTVFEEHQWLDNIVQFLCERGLKLMKMLVQKFIMKQDLPLSEFLMN